jgi:hypothetical protein
MSEKFMSSTPNITPEMQEELRSKIKEWLPEVRDLLPGLSPSVFNIKSSALLCRGCRCS